MKNFLPGPTEVHPDLLKELTRPIISHHSPEFREIIKRIKPRLRKLLGTEGDVFTLTCTASTAMEAALLNAAGVKTLIISNGAFGERWLQAARAFNLPADGLVLGWGLPIPPYEVRRLLERVAYDTVVIVHGESSTGMLNPLEPITAVLANHPHVIFILDAVSTIGGFSISMDSAGVDVLVGASQKCLALPPGIVPIGVSQRALERSRHSRRKGYSLDFCLWHERWLENQTVATPAIPQIRALDLQLKRLKEESLEIRFRRHQNMADRMTAWAEDHALIPFPPVGYRLPSISCLRPVKGGNTTGIVKELMKKGYWIDAGYGKLKGKSLRIGHMGEWTENDLEGLLEALTEVLSRWRQKPAFK